MKNRYALLAAILFTFACSNPADQPGSDGGAPETITIGVMPKLIGIDYFNACAQGASEAAQELGINLVYDGPTVDDVAKQAEMLDSWIIRKFDAICVAPNDRDAIGPTLAKAKQRGVHAISWDAEGSERETHVNMTLNKDIAATLVDIVTRNIGETGEYAILTGRLTAANQNEWIKYIREYIKEQNLGLVEVALKTSEEDQTVATQVTGDLLKTYPNLKAIFAITSVALPGAARALEEAGAQDRVFLTGLSTPKSMKQYIDKGILKEFALWNPVDLGYLTVHTAYRLVKGLPVDQPFEAGRLGTVEANDNEVILGKPLIFTKENVGSFNF